jgi:hypothetical protein
MPRSYTTPWGTIRMWRQVIAAIEKLRQSKAK